MGGPNFDPTKQGFSEANPPRGTQPASTYFPPAPSWAAALPSRLKEILGRSPGEAEVGRKKILCEAPRIPETGGIKNGQKEQSSGVLGLHLKFLGKKSYFPADLRSPPGSLRKDP